MDLGCIWLLNAINEHKSYTMVTKSPPTSFIGSYAVFLAQLVCSFTGGTLKRLSIMLHKVGSSFSAVRIHALGSSKNVICCDTTGTATATGAASWFIRQCWGVRHGWNLKLERAHMTSTETLGQFHLASGPAVLRLA
jgi:hypothetical protein